MATTQSRWRGYLKEMVIWIVILFVVSTLINYLRAPKLKSNQLYLPATTLLDGSTYQIPKGEPVVLHFWGRWCPVCRAESGNIERIAQDYHVITVAVNSGSDDTLRNYMHAHNLHFPVINDPQGELASHYQVTVFPTTFIFDRNGTLRFTETGYTTTAGLIARLHIIGALKIKRVK